jgi:hypothetical protein
MAWNSRPTPTPILYRLVIGACVATKVVYAASVYREGKPFHEVLAALTTTPRQIADANGKEERKRQREAKRAAKRARTSEPD